ncbi:hypothetical protein HK102_004192 [Quaeritorhiza haematococci]|nr:hypothetical protein HK102_004192 [Quaeritorhiza haematococci]
MRKREEEIEKERLAEELRGQVDALKAEVERLEGKVKEDGEVERDEWPKERGAYVEMEEELTKLRHLLNEADAQRAELQQQVDSFSGLEQELEAMRAEHLKTIEVQRALESEKDDLLQHLSSIKFEKEALLGKAQHADLLSLSLTQQKTQHESTKSHLLREIEKLQKELERVERENQKMVYEVEERGVFWEKRLEESCVGKEVLREEIERLQGLLGDKTVKCEGLVREKEEGERERVRMREEFEERIVEFNDLQERCAGLETEKRDLEVVVDELRALREASEARCGEWEKQVLEAREAWAQAQRDLADVKVANQEEKSQLLEERDRFEREAQSAGEQVTELEQSLEEMKAEKEALEETLAQLRETSEKSQQETDSKYESLVRSLEERCQHWEEQATSALAEKQGFELKYSELQTEIHQHADIVSTIKGDHEKEISRLEESFMALEKDHTSLKTTVDRLKADNHHLENECESLKEQLTSQTSLTEQLEKLTTLNHELTESLHQKDILLSEHEKHHAELTETIETLTTQSTTLQEETEKKAAENEILRLKCAELESGIAALEEVGRVNSEASTTLQNALKEVEEQLRETIEAKEELERSLAGVEERVRKEVEGREEVLGRCEQLQEELRRAVEVKEGLEETLAQLEEKIRVGEADAASEAEERYARLEKELREIVEAKEDLEQTLAQLEETIRVKEADAANEAQEKYAKLEEELRGTVEAKEDLEQKLAHLEENIRVKEADAANEAQEKYARLEEELRETLEAKEGLEQTLASLEESMRKETEVKDELQERCDGLEEELRQAVSAKEDLERTVSEFTETMRVKEAEIADRITTQSEEKCSRLEEGLRETVAAKEELELRLGLLEESVRDKEAIVSEAQEKCSELEEELRAAVAAKEELAQSLGELEESVRNNEAIASEAHEKCSELEEELRAAVAVKEELAQSLGRLGETMREKDAVAVETQEKCSELEEQLRQTVAAKEDLERTLSQLEETIRLKDLDLTAVKEENQLALTNAERLQTEVTDLLNQLAEKSESHANLSLKREELESELREQQGLVEKMQEEHEDAVRELEETIEALRGEKEDACGDVERLEAELTAKTEECESHQQALDAIRELEETIESLRSEKEDACNDVERLEAELKGKTEECESHQQALDAIHDLEETIESLRSEKEDACNDVERLEAELTVKTEECESHQQALDSLKQDAKAANEKYQAIECDKQMLEELVSKLEGDLGKHRSSAEEEQEQLSEQVDSLEQECEGLRQREATLLTEKADAELAFEKLREEQKTLVTALETQKLDIERLQTVVAELEGEKTALTEQISDLEEEKQRTAESLSQIQVRLQSEISELEKQNSDLTGQLEGLVSENSELKDGQASLEEEHRSVIAELESKCGDHESSLQSLETLNAGLKQEIEGLNTQLVELRGGYDACILEVDKHKTENQGLRSELDAYVLKCTKLQADRDELRHGLDECILTVTKLQNENIEFERLKAKDVGELEAQLQAMTETKNVLDQQLATLEARHQHQSSSLKQLADQLLGELRVLKVDVNEELGNVGTSAPAPTESLNRITCEFTQLFDYIARLQNECKQWSLKAEHLASRLSDAETNLVQLSSVHEATRNERDLVQKMVNELQLQVCAAEKESQQRLEEIARAHEENVHLARFNAEIKHREQALLHKEESLMEKQRESEEERIRLVRELEELKTAYEATRNEREVAQETLHELQKQVYAAETASDRNSDALVKAQEQAAQLAKLNIEIKQREHALLDREQTLLQKQRESEEERIRLLGEVEDLRSALEATKVEAVREISTTELGSESKIGERSLSLVDQTPTVSGAQKEEHDPVLRRENSRAGRERISQLWTELQNARGVIAELERTIVEKDSQYEELLTECEELRLSSEEKCDADASEGAAERHADAGAGDQPKVTVVVARQMTPTATAPNHNIEPNGPDSAISLLNDGPSVDLITRLQEEYKQSVSTLKNEVLQLTERLTQCEEERRSAQYALEQITSGKHLLEKVQQDLIEHAVLPMMEKTTRNEAIQRDKEGLIETQLHMSAQYKEMQMALAAVEKSFLELRNSTKTSRSHLSRLHEINKKVETLFEAVAQRDRIIRQNQHDIRERDDLIKCFHVRCQELRQKYVKNIGQLKAKVAEQSEFIQNYAQVAHVVKDKLMRKNERLKLKLSKKTDDSSDGLLTVPTPFHLRTAGISTGLNQDTETVLRMPEAADF